MKKYIKKFLPIILAVSIMLCSIVLCTTVVDFCSGLTPIANAADADDLVYTDFGDGTCYVNGFPKKGEMNYSGELIIPETLKGMKVVGLGQNAFKDCTGLTKVVIPDAVKVIPDGAFKGCTNLETIVMSDNITSIGWSAFQDCANLNDITIPNNLTKLGSKAFNGTAYYNNEANWENGILYLETFLLATREDISGEVTIKDGTTVMVDNAFKDRENITKVTIPGSLSVVSKEAFYDCTNLEEIVLSEGVKKIEELAFQFCTKLYKMTIPASFEEFARTALGSARITEPYYNGTVDQWANIKFNSYGNNPIYTANTLYINGEKLTEAVFSTPVINDYAFYDCETLERVTFTDSVVEIGNQAFGNNFNIKEISIGKNLKKVAYQAFTYCSRVEKVNTTMTVNEWSQIDFNTWDSNPVAHAKCLYINGELLENVVLSDVTSIKPYTFFSLSPIKSISIPYSVEVIGKSAFSGTSIEELVIPEGVTKIEADAFSGCKNLKSVTLPNTLTDIDSEAFLNATSLTYVNFNGTIEQWASIDFFRETSNPVYYSKNLHLNGELVENAVIGNIESINSYTFVNCESLKTLYICDGVEAVYSSAFSGCSNLESVDLPNSVTHFSNKEFSGCSNLKKVNYRGTVDQWAVINFYSETSNPVYHSHCLYLNDILLEDTVIKEAYAIKSYTFINCDSLKTLVVGGNVATIYSSAFENCDGLISADIQGSTFSGSFRYCSSLVQVNISEEGKSFHLGSYTFYECTALEEIILPKRVTGMGNATFKKCTSLKTVYLSSEIGRIGYDAFYDCPSLEIVYYESDEVDYAEINVQYGNEALFMAETHYNVEDVESHYTTITVNATCTEDGSITKSCPCGYSSFTILHAANHKPVLANQKDATCTTEGYTGDTICEACKEVFEYGIKIKCLGHIGGLATCTEQAKCERCNEYYGELVPHSFASNNNAKCNVCGYEKESDITQQYVQDNIQKPVQNNTQKPPVQDNIQNTVQNNEQNNVQGDIQNIAQDDAQAPNKKELYISIASAVLVSVLSFSGIYISKRKQKATK